MARERSANQSVPHTSNDEKTIPTERESDEIKKKCDDADDKNNSDSNNINNTIDYLDIDTLPKSQKITPHKWDSELSRRKLLLFYYLIRGQTFNW